MRLIWASFLGLVINLAIVNKYIAPLGEVTDYLVIAHLLIVIGMLVLKGGELRGVLIAALLARSALMVWSIFFGHIYELPNSGIDAPIYMAHAIDVSQDMTLWYRYLRTGLYSRLLGTLFYLTGPSQMLAQYVNVLLGLSTLIVLHRTMQCLKIADRPRKQVMLLAAFFPNAMIMSAILLREMLATFFLMTSVYYFVRWFGKRKLSFVVLSMMALVAASAFHSALFGVLPGFGMALLFYRHSSDRFVFTPRSLASLGLLLAVGFLVLGVFRYEILSNFRNINKPTDVFPLVNTREGDAAYLTSLVVNSFGQVILYTPLRLIYFFFAPLPFEWRGAADALTFILDACFYAYVVYLIVTWRRRYGNYRPFMLILLLSLLGAGIVFALGTGNAGTAFRHRQKLTPLLFLALAIIKHQQGGYRTLEQKRHTVLCTSQALR